MLIGWFVGRRDAFRNRSRSKDQGDLEGQCPEYGEGSPVRHADHGQECTTCQQGPAEHAGQDERAGEGAEHVGKETAGQGQEGPSHRSRV